MLDTLHRPLINTYGEHLFCSVHGVHTDVTEMAKVPVRALNLVGAPNSSTTTDLHQLMMELHPNKPIVS